MPMYTDFDLNTALSVSHVLIDEYGYVSKIQAMRNKEISTAAMLEAVCSDLIYTGDCAAVPDLLIKIENYKHRPLVKQAMWWLNMLERLDGHSDFTKQARIVLESAEDVTDWSVVAYLAHKMTPPVEQMGGMPSTALNMPISKTVDIPGIWQIRKVMPHHSFYGPKVFIVCADEMGQGVCFSIEPAKHKAKRLAPGVFVSLRAGVKGLGEGRQYLMLERVQIKPYQVAD